MNKLQKISLWFTILSGIHYAIHVLLGFPLLFTWIQDESFLESLYAFLIGLSAFINITIFTKNQ